MVQVSIEGLYARVPSEIPQVIFFFGVDHYLGRLLQPEMYTKLLKQLLWQILQAIDFQSQFSES